MILIDYVVNAQLNHSIFILLALNYYILYKKTNVNQVINLAV
jgi:hypothetical protein